MITWETKVNGILISHIYCHNAQQIVDDDYLYKYEYYEIGRKQLITKYVRHTRSEGTLVLLNKILKSLRKEMMNEREDC